VLHDDQAVFGKRRQGVPDDAGADALPRTQLGDRRQLVTRGEDAGPDGLGENPGDLLPGRAAITWIDHQGRNVAVLSEGPAGAGQVAAALQP